MSEQLRSAKSRSYTMRARAGQVDQTRQRIVEAAIELHRTAGMQAPVTDIARAAGVTRATFYRHFPDSANLYRACSAHWRSAQQFPDPATWSGADTAARLRAALADVYRYYAAGADMLVKVHAGIDLIPTDVSNSMRERGEAIRDAIVALVAPSPVQRPRVTAVAGHVTSFEPWRSLALVHGLAQEDCVELMAGMLENAAELAR